MTKQFERKVLLEGSVDTRQYRYRWHNDVIERIPLCFLGTTTALNRDAWEIVEVYDYATSAFIAPSEYKRRYGISVFVGGYGRYIYWID